jgi:hypothetical protein
MSLLQQRAATGASWLDSIRPGWFRRIDLRTLDISSDDCCIVGQLFGSFNRCVLSVDAGNFGFPFPLDTAPFGMEPIHKSDKNFRKLTEAWKREVQARLSV